MPDPATEPVRLKFWGVRGSIPVPGPSTAAIGGNTACVEVRAGSDFFILDAGTGIRLLGLALDEEFKSSPLELTLLLSHTHWDHIQGIPFFRPAYMKQNRLRILGCNSQGVSLRETLGGQMAAAYFPIPMSVMSARITIDEIKAPEFSIGSVKIRVARINHPGLPHPSPARPGRSSTQPALDCWSSSAMPMSWFLTPSMTGRNTRTGLDGGTPASTTPCNSSWRRVSNNCLFFTMTRRTTTRGSCKCSPTPANKPWQQEAR